MTGPVQALIVVDMQRGLLTGPEAVADAATLTARVEELIRRATDAGALAVLLQDDGASGQVDEPGKPGWELALAAARHPHAALVTRSSSSPQSPT